MMAASDSVKDLYIASNHFQETDHHSQGVGWVIKNYKSYSRVPAVCEIEHPEKATENSNPQIYYMSVFI